MNAIVICPEVRPLGGTFHRMKPLALMPVLGRPLIDHALSQLAREGVTEVIVLASDRPAQIRRVVRHGEAWGLRVNVIPTSIEVSPQLALLEHAPHFSSVGETKVVVLDRVPQLDDAPLWLSSEGTFAALRSLIRNESTAAQLTMREMSPGVWISTKARVSSLANISGPAWIGANVSVCDGARIGPNSIIEAGAFIDSRSVVEDSWVGPDTYVGPAMNVQHSLVWGDGITNWRNGSFLEVKDAFLLCDISKKPRSERRSGIIERILAATLMFAATPIVLPAMLNRLLRGKTVFRERRCILPPPGKVNDVSRTYQLLTLESFDSLLQRWPELWRVIRGDMALVGNRPLSHEAASSLRGESAHGWLALPAGVFSLADAEKVDGECTTEAIAYAAYYTAHPTLRLRLSILLRCLAAPFTDLFTSSPSNFTQTSEAL